MFQSRSIYPCREIVEQCSFSGPPTPSHRRSPNVPTKPIRDRHLVVQIAEKRRKELLNAIVIKLAFCQGGELSMASSGDGYVRFFKRFCARIRG